MLLLFFLLASGTLAALAWSAFELVRDQNDPLTQRLEELQAHAMASTANAPRRRGRGLTGNALYLISLAPGGEGWLRDAEEELAQAGIRQKQALALYALGHLAFLFSLIAAALSCSPAAVSSSSCCVRDALVCCSLNAGATVVKYAPTLRASSMQTPKAST